MRKRLIIFALFAVVLPAVAAGLLFLSSFDKELLRPGSQVVTDHEGRPLRIFLSEDDKWRFHVSLDEVSPVLVDTVIAYEDKYFHYHPGVNPLSLARAMVQNFRAGRVVSGGSTLTMQIARMTNPKERTYINKLREIFLALQLEMSRSKEEILEIYFNLAPYGGNIEGVGAAAWLYLGKGPEKLSISEAAFLAGLPRSPESNRPDRFPEKAKESRDRVLKRLLDMGRISLEEYRDASTRDIPKGRQPLTYEAAHLCRLLAARYPGAGRITSTIDRGMQGLARTRLRGHLDRMRKKGISNGSVVIIENRTRAVRAMVGSYDFFETGAAGQINGALAPRSPGSTLKPFLYARALDQGLISPQMLLADVPVDYSGYQPENYDGKYSGMVSMEEALVRSLNVPPVNLQARMGNDGLFHVLRKAGLSTIRGGRERYGLSIVLGGCEVTLLELTNLYAALADRGSFRKARLTEDEILEPGRRIFSPAAAYIVAEILTDLKRPDLPEVWAAAFNIPLIAWKTGTSYGRRDAWSIGYNPEYTIGVWVGNFSGEGVPELVGSQAAAPLLMDLFNALAKDEAGAWFTRPPEVGTRMVCALSGMIPGPDCERTKEELYIRDSSPVKICDMHIRHDIDEETGYRLCSHCRVGRDYHSELFTLWPGEVATWMIQNGMSLNQVPEHLPLCTRLAQGEPPVIRSPQANGNYMIRTGVSVQEQKIALISSVANHIRNIFWFVDGTLYWSGPPTDKVFYLPEPGVHSLVCMDEEGRRSEVKIRVE